MNKINKIGIEVELAVFQIAKPVVCGFLPYTKDDPYDIGGTLFHKDASMFEIAMPPCVNGIELDDEYQKAMVEVRKLLPQGHHIELRPAVEYSNEQLESDPYASVLGCGASQNLYGRDIQMPDEYENNVRYAGLHVNIEGVDELPPRRTVLGLDAVLGLKSVRDWERSWSDAIRQRRTLYGSAGEFRVKDFGIEYRTLPSCAWTHTDGTELFTLVNRALNTDFDELVPYADDIQDAINTSNSNKAGELMNEIFGGEAWAQ